MRTISLSRRTAVSAAATLSIAAASIVGVAMAPAANATGAAITLSTATGPTGGTNAVTATTAAATFATGLAAEFQYKATASSTCSAAYSAAVAQTTGAGIVLVSSPHILNSKKIAFTVPALTLTPAGVSATSSSWLLCVYPGTNTTTSLLSANAAYTVAAPPSITSITPASGPALGGGTVTIVGTNLLTGTTVKIGSTALTGVVVASGGLSLTATVPPQAAGAAMNVTVTNTQGTGTSVGGYTYTNGIIVSPDTTPTNTASTDVDVQGVGFSGLTFSHTTGTLPEDPTAHVYLVAGAYDDTSGSGLGGKTIGETGECLNVLVISDGELICTVDTADSDGAAGSGSTPIANGTYTLTTVANGAAPATSPVANPSIVSSGSTFTVAPY